MAFFLVSEISHYFFKTGSLYASLMLEVIQSAIAAASTDGTRLSTGCCWSSRNTSNDEPPSKSGSVCFRRNLQWYDPCLLLLHRSHGLMPA